MAATKKEQGTVFKVYYYRPENSSSKSNDEALGDCRPSTSISQPENLTAEKIKMKF